MINDEFAAQLRTDRIAAMQRYDFNRERIVEALMKSAYGTKNKTFTAQEIKKSLLGDRFRSLGYLQYAVLTGENILFEGTSGIAKTGFIKAFFKTLNLINEGKDLPRIEPVFFDCSTMTPENLGASIPTSVGEGVRLMDFVLTGKLAETDTLKVVILDEANRGKAQVQSMVMELRSEGTINGVPVPGLLTVLSIQNPHGAGFSTVANGDLASATRAITPDAFSAKDFPWQEWLAAQHPDLDLKPMFRHWESMPEEHRIVLSPRVIDSMLWNQRSAGISAFYAVPAPNTKRAVLNNNAGEDVTVEQVQALMDGAGIGYLSQRPGDLDRVRVAASRDRKNVWQIARHGVGKSSAARADAANRGVNLVCLSGPMLRPTNFGAVFPGKTVSGADTLSFALSRQFQDGEFDLVMDEGSRCLPSAQNIRMELIQERTVMGIPVPMRGYFQLDNPRELVIGVDASGKPVVEKYDVGQVDLAQASRFQATFIEADEELDAYGHLLGKYGQVAEAFVAWHREDLDDLGRHYVAPRVLEKMIKLHLHGAANGLPLDDALPSVGGVRVPVPLALLQRRLDEKPVHSFSAMVEDVEKWVAICKDKDNSVEDYRILCDVLTNTETATLERHRDAVVQFLSWMAPSERMYMLTGVTDERKKYVSGLIKDGAQRKLAQ